MNDIKETILKDLDAIKVEIFGYVLRQQESPDCDNVNLAIEVLCKDWGVNWSVLNMTVLTNNLKYEPPLEAYDNPLWVISYIDKIISYIQEIKDIGWWHQQVFPYYYLMHILTNVVIRQETIKKVNEARKQKQTLNETISRWGYAR